MAKAMRKMNRTPRGRAFAYALSEGVLAGSEGYGGVGVVIKGRTRQRVLALDRQVGEGSRAGVRFAAIAEALRACRGLGLRRVVVYCHDPGVVDQVNRRTPTRPETRARCLEVRALMNMFANAEVRSIPWIANLEATWLARQAALRPSPDVARKLQPSLPLDAA
jgi:ribonuclease HI